MPVDLSEQSVLDALRGRFGRPLRYVEQIGSTNTEALAWAAAGAPEGALVVTDHQTGGKGRWGRSWFSAPGQLLQWSLVLRPRLEARELGRLVQVAGVACARGIEAVTPLRVSLKWPNDVTVERRKLAGILLESRLVGNTLDAVVVGVGINVGWTGETLPTDIAASATSLRVELADAAKVPPRAVLLAAVLEELERAYAQLHHDASDVVAEARSRSEIVGRRIRVTWAGGGTTEGTGIHLSADGELYVRSDDGGTVVVTTGEVEQVRPLT